MASPSGSQLVPSLANDVYLTAYVVPHRDRLKLGDYKKELEVVYVLDYGVGRAMSSDGAVLGYYRVIDYGSVVYVPVRRSPR